MELKQVGERTYYIQNPTNIGIYRVNDIDVYLIDTGNDKDAGKKILKIVEEQGWKVKGIITTHSNADHIGGNQVIQDRTNCEVLAYGMEGCLTEYPILEPTFLYGGYPMKEWQNKFLCAKPSKVKPIEGNLPEGLEWFSLKGHFLDMIGIKTSDDVYFLADSLFSAETIQKYAIFFVYDVKGYLETLQTLKTLQGKWYIPSHCEATESIQELIDLNEQAIQDVSQHLCKICQEAKTWEQIVKQVFDEDELVMNPNQYLLIGSTIKSYLSYLVEEKRMTFFFRENRMFWQTGTNPS